MDCRPSRSMDLYGADGSRLEESYLVIPGEATVMIRFHDQFIYEINHSSI